MADDGNYKKMFPGTNVHRLDKLEGMVKRYEPIARIFSTIGWKPVIQFGDEATPER